MPTHAQCCRRILLQSLLLWGLPVAELAAASLDIRFEGAPQSQLADNIRAHIGELGDRSAEQLQNYLPIARERAQTALQALGYYQSELDLRVKRSREPKLVLKVDPGMPVRLRQIDVVIRGDTATRQVFSGLGPSLKSGDILDHGQYEALKTALLNEASRLGYFDRSFLRKQLRVDPQGGTADIEILFDPGPRYVLGAISFTGDTPIEEALLQRLAPFRGQVPYDSSLIVEFNRNLQATGYFASVRVDANPDQAEEQVIPIRVALAARKPRTFGIGGGFSTDVGPRMNFEWTRHWANPQGHAYGVTAQLSAVKQNVGLWYEIPGDPPLTNKLRLAGGYQYQEIADTDTRSSLLTIGPEWHSTLESGWVRIYSLKLQNEEYELGDDSGNSTLLMPGLSYSILHTDNRIDPHNGYRIEGSMAVAKKGLISDFDMLRGHLQIKGLTTLWQKHRLLGRIELGANLIHGYSQVPPSLRFFAGGDQSVRGYDYQELSPTNSDGDRIGGRYMAVFSGEYQYALTDKWRLAAFVDQGNAFNNESSPSLKTSLGLGVRYVSPVGPIRVDVARGLDSNDGDDPGFHLHFSMGPEL